MSWFRSLDNVPHGRLSGEVVLARLFAKRPWGRPRTRWRDYISRLVWERLSVPPEELVEVDGESGVSVSPCSGCCPHNLDPDKHQENGMK